MLEQKKRIFSFNQIIICILMFFAGMNVFEKHSYCIFLAFAVLLLSQKDIKLDKYCAVLTLFSVSYVLFFDLQSLDLMGSLRRLGMPMCYIIGYNFILRNDATLKSNERVDRNIVLPIVSIALGATMHYLLNYILNVGNTNRNGLDIWSGKVMAATGQAMLAVLGVGIFVAVLFSDYTLKTKLCAIVGLVLILMYNFILAGRTLPLLIFIVAAVCFLYKMKHSNMEHKIRIVCIVFGVIVLFALAFFRNWFGIQDMILNSNLVNRFEENDITDTSRWERKQLYLRNLLMYPFGGNGLYDLVGGYAHDLILDAYSDAGIITVIFLMVFMVMSIARTIQFVLRAGVGYSAKLIVISVNIVILICFFFEPIFQGMPWLFSTYCFIQGIIVKGTRST